MRGEMDAVVVAQRVAVASSFLCGLPSSDPLSRLSELPVPPIPIRASANGPPDFPAGRRQSGTHDGLEPRVSSLALGRRGRGTAATRQSGLSLLRSSGGPAFP